MLNHPACVLAQLGRPLLHRRLGPHLSTSTLEGTLPSSFQPVSRPNLGNKKPRRDG